MNKYIQKRLKFKSHLLCLIASLSSAPLYANIELEEEIFLTDKGLYFNGDKKSSTKAAENDPDVGPEQYDYMYGPAINPHGDCIKVYKNFVFMTWYRGGKDDRHVMLTRYNTTTGKKVTIEFPHRHTGYSNRWWIGETHNTIAIGLSPKNESIHMVFDQHSLSPTNPSDGSAANDYFKYYYSKPNSLTVPDEEFTLDLFVKDDYYDGNDPVNAKFSPADELDEYKHITLNGEVNANKFQALSYPKFFTTNEGDLFLYMRKGRSQNGNFSYIRYDGAKWQTGFKEFNRKEALSRGNAYNYGVYGEMKYLNGKIRIGFQQRANVTDKYKYQNGFFGAYSDDPTGQSDWKNYNHETLSEFPVLNTDPIKVSEPGDLYPDVTETSRLSMVGGFDWTVTDNDDVHFIGKVTDTIDRANTKVVHTYRKGGTTEFTTTTDFAGADELYTSGNDIYIIGLSNGRPYIDKAPGGTNDFVRVYAPTTGKTFSKGVPYIDDGKLYYYLLESSSGDARPLHLQVINLALGAQSAPSISFTQHPETLLVGYKQIKVALNAASPEDDRTISSVSLYVGDTLVSEMTSGPYSWDESNTVLAGLAAGEHIIKAVVTDSQNETSEETININVVPPTPTISFNQQKVSLSPNYSALSLSVNANTPDPARTITSVSLYLDNELVSELANGPYQWTQAEAKLSKLALGSYTAKAIVTDSQNETAETTIQINVVDNTPVVAFAQNTLNLTEGYASLSLDIAASTPVDSLSIKQVDLYINNNLIRKESVAPYEWGHTNSPNSAELLNLPIGEHTFKAIVTDSSDVTAEATMQVIVSAVAPVPTPPTVSFSAMPTDLTEGYSSIAVSTSAAATTPAASIEHVALYVNDVLVSQDTEEPYQWTATSSALLGLTAGSHTLKAIATDTSGLTIEAQATISVAEAAMPEPTPEPTPDPEPTPTPEPTSSPSEDNGNDSNSDSGGGSTGILFWVLTLLLVCRRSLFNAKAAK
ncbi:Ig-like domain-containing protein [Algibacillus agarilyticus]|uniref:Ig-like domain-containing protein n=1 Tax=Algibacillus agarilyticus TaxID=2234133 RepID=UPI000DD0A247|nr:Ig-like domain-containing protein [Algibacillus agarilyticus]